MQEASSEPSPAPLAGDADGGTVSARASAGAGWHVPEIAVVLLEGPPGARGMNARGRKSQRGSSGRRQGHGSVTAAITCRYTCYLRSPARLAPVRREVLPGLVNRADPAEGGLICRSG